MFLTDVGDSGRLMQIFADLIDENVEELAALQALDAGKLIGLCKARDIRFGALIFFVYKAGAADKIHGEVLKMSRELQGYILR